jgi:hypothetical protein
LPRLVFLRSIFFLFVIIFPRFLKPLNADFIPERRFILAVVLGFLFANIRTVLKLGDIWEYKRVKDIKRLLPVYFMNYPITLVAICLIGSYFLLDIWNLSKTVSWYILFCLGFAPNSIFEIITDPRSLIPKAKNLGQ